MRDASDDQEPLFVVDCEDDAVVSDPDARVVPTGEVTTPSVTALSQAVDRRCGP
jgi:hypothetical protein